VLEPMWMRSAAPGLRSAATDVLRSATTDVLRSATTDVLPPLRQVADLAKLLRVKVLIT
jgi:hypothetical protein